MVQQQQAALVLQPDIKAAMAEDAVFSIAVGIVMSSVAIFIGKAAAVITLIFPILLLNALAFHGLRRRRYVFRKDRLEAYEGVLDIEDRTIPYERITNVRHSKSKVERYFGTGTIILDIGRGKDEIHMNHIKEPMKQFSKVKNVTTNLR